MARSRNKIRYCYNDYLEHSDEEERERYQRLFAPLAAILETTEDDRQIIDQARRYDSEHGTEIFAEAVRLTAYCIACHKMDCDC